MGTKARLKGERERRRNEQIDFDQVYSDANKAALKNLVDRHDKKFGKPPANPQRRNFYHEAEQFLDEYFAELFTIEYKVQAVLADMDKESNEHEA